MQVHVPNTPQAVVQARQSIADSLDAWGFGGSVGDGAMVDDLLLIASELLSNAVKFSSGDVALVLRWGGATIRVTVTDNAPAPAALRASGPEAIGGRGLAIIDALSARWGQTPYADGCKEVWAEVSVTPRLGGSGGSPATVTLEE